jgi:hypothetical protein
MRDQDQTARITSNDKRYHSLLPFQQSHRFDQKIVFVSGGLSAAISAAEFFRTAILPLK